MGKERPLIITFIGDVNVLSAGVSIVLSIASLFPGCLESLGFTTISSPFFSEGIMKVLLPIILLIVSYGFLKLKIWGYWLMVIYDILFLVVYIVCCLQNKQILLPINVITVFIELIFVLPTKKYFYKNTLSA